MTKLKKIMVVDDEPNIRSLLSGVLIDQGYEVSVAEDGRDSLAKLRKRKFDLLITDVEMPRLDGIGLVKKMKRAGRKEKVIVMTGKSTGQITLRKKIPTAIPLLFKPFQMTRFLEIVTSTLNLENGTVDQRLRQRTRKGKTVHAL